MKKFGSIAAALVNAMKTADGAFKFIEMQYDIARDFEVDVEAVRDVLDELYNDGYTTLFGEYEDVYKVADKLVEDNLNGTFVAAYEQAAQDVDYYFKHEEAKEACLQEVTELHVSMYMQEQYTKYMKVNKLEAEQAQQDLENGIITYQMFDIIFGQYLDTVAY